VIFYLFFRHRQHVGFIDDSHQPSGSTNRLIVSSHENVVASLDLSSRKIGNYLSLFFYFFHEHERVKIESLQSGNIKMLFNE
jgi:hypothetical protein